MNEASLSRDATFNRRVRIHLGWLSQLQRMAAKRAATAALKHVGQRQLRAVKGRAGFG